MISNNNQKFGRKKPNERIGQKPLHSEMARILEEAIDMVGKDPKEIPIYYRNIMSISAHLREVLQQITKFGLKHAEKILKHQQIDSKFKVAYERAAKRHCNKKGESKIEMDDIILDSLSSDDGVA